MCFTFSFENKASQSIKDYCSSRGNVVINTQLDSDYPLIGGLSHPFIPIVKADRVEACQWGFIPPFANGDNYKEFQNLTLNSRSESVFDKPSFRHSIMESRGVVVMDGFYEWRHYNKNTYPYYIFPKGDDVFYVGCIYNAWVNRLTGEVIDSFSIITTNANSLMERIHNTKKRMPLILNKGEIDYWMDSKLERDDIERLMKPFDDEKMSAYSIKKINVSKDEGLSSLQIKSPFSYTELELLDSF
ncbi:MAG TPA: hypothetical protein DD434_02285 [Bacteroidales bacterium]|nr:hypothetical protein [Bacteroidales bacterium]